MGTNQLLGAEMGVPRIFQKSLVNGQIENVMKFQALPNSGFEINMTPREKTEGDLIEFSGCL